MTPVTAYQTEDGHLFPSREEAEKYEAEFSVKSFANAQGYAEMDRESLGTFLLVHSRTLVPLLTEYNRTRRASG